MTEISPRSVKYQVEGLAAGKGVETDQEERKGRGQGKERLTF